MILERKERENEKKNAMKMLPILDEKRAENRRLSPGIGLKGHEIAANVGLLSPIAPCEGEEVLKRPPKKVLEAQRLRFADYVTRIARTYSQFSRALSGLSGNEASLRRPSRTAHFGFTERARRASIGPSFFCSFSANCLSPFCANLLLP